MLFLTHVLALLPLLKLGRCSDCMLDGVDPSLFHMVLDYIVMAQVLSELADTADHQTKNDNASDRIRKYKSPSNIVRRMKIAKANSENGNIAKVQGIDI